MAIKIKFVSLVGAFKYIILNSFSVSGVFCTIFLPKEVGSAFHLNGSFTDVKSSLSHMKLIPSDQIKFSTCFKMLSVRLLSVYIILCP